MPRTQIATAYDARADEYVERLGSVAQLAARDRVAIEGWAQGVGGPLLDAGCGPGHWADLLSAGGRRRVLGVDASACLLASARRRFPQVGFVRGDLARLPLPTASLNGVLAWFSIIHTAPAQVPAVLGELARVLRPGGSLLLGYYEGEPGTPFPHAVTTAYHWSAASLGELLGPHGFVVERATARQEPGQRRQGELVARLGC